MNRSVTDFVRLRIPSTRDRTPRGFLAGGVFDSFRERMQGPPDLPGGRCLQGEIDMNRRNLLAFKFSHHRGDLEARYRRSAGRAAPPRPSVRHRASGVGDKATLICKDILNWRDDPVAPLGATVLGSGRNRRKPQQPRRARARHQPGGAERRFCARAMVC